MSSFFTTASSSTAATPVADKDIEVADPPTDSISSLAFSPQADYLAVGSWDNNVSSPRRWCCVRVVDGIRGHSGADIRSWSERTDAGEGNVWAPRPCVERVLEQGLWPHVFSNHCVGSKSRV